MQITFCWAAKIVSWSCYLLETNTTKFLVDCWMFQWVKDITRLNYEPFKFDPKSIDFMLLTHAHIDHCGLIPKLHKEWFEGKIYATSATIDLVEILLEDSAKIQEQTTEEENKRRKRNWLPARKPLFTLEDAQSCMALFSPIDYWTMISLTDAITARYQDAGHIIWSASIEVFVTEWTTTKKLVFSGDIGQWDTPIVRDPTLIQEADYVFMESTYGDRLHEEWAGKEDLLLQYALETYKKWGKLLIPTFAVERAQELLYYFNKLIIKKAFPQEKIFLDSPLAEKATTIFKEHTECYDTDALENYTTPFDPEYLECSVSVQDSQRLNSYKEPCAILAGNGMCTAGRITHHLKHWLWDKRNTLVFVWYQAEWTLGRVILEWAKRVRMMWVEVDVNADIKKINGFSGHADANQLLKRAKWFTTISKKLFIVHGEWKAQETLQKSLNDLWIVTYIPSLGECIEL